MGATASGSIQGTPSGVFAISFFLASASKDGRWFFGFNVVDGLFVTLAVSGERRVDEARNNGVDGDLVLAQFQGGRLHQTDDAPFGGGIGGAVFRAMPALR